MKEKEMQVFEGKILPYALAVKGKMALEGRRIDKISGICHFLTVENSGRARRKDFADQ